MSNEQQRATPESVAMDTDHDQSGHGTDGDNINSHNSHNSHNSNNNNVHQKLYNYHFKEVKVIKVQQ